MSNERDVVLVTGASQGIGREIALAFADIGCRLVLTARNLQNLESTAELAAQRGAEAIVLAADMTDADQVQGMVHEALEQLGRIDVLVCNSGIAGPTAPLWEIPPEQWEETIRVNLSGVFYCCRAVLPGMLERRRGSIVVIGSMTGKRPLHGRTPYTSSKLGLVGLVRTLAWETGLYGVRVNLISPGAVRGPRIDSVIDGQASSLGISPVESLARFTSGSPLDRLTEPAEVAAAAVFLASPAAAAITGEDLNVSAGVAMY
jgi:NAD(P)-dependent dehydrogenase (short-subunit alcohol dehydrogenase family)